MVVYSLGHLEGLCKRCSIKFVSKNLFKEHTKLNHRSSQQVFICPKCGKHVNSKNRLKAHVRVKHENILCKCHLCEVPYSRKYVLNDHIAAILITRFHFPLLIETHLPVSYRPVSHRIRQESPDNMCCFS